MLVLLLHALRLLLHNGVLESLRCDERNLQECKGHFRATRDKA